MSQETKTDSDAITDEIWKLTLEDEQERMEEPRDSMEECVHDSDEEQDDIFVESLFSTGKTSTQDLQTGALKSNCGEQSSDQSEEPENDNKHKPMFPSCDLKLGTAMLLLCLLMMKHNLTQSAMDDFLALLTVLLPNGNLIARNYSVFSDFFFLN